MVTDKLCKSCKNCKCKTVVWVNGCFDVLHYGHLRLLEYAASLGDYLVVGIDSDDKVRQAKGPKRPIFNEQERKFMLECLKFVDEVTVFNNQQALENTIRAIKPDIMVVGSDWRGKEVVGSKWAGKVKFFDRIAGLSTSLTIERIVASYPKERIRR